MQERSLVIRKVNRSTYRRFRQKVIEEQSSVGEAVTEAMEFWMEEKKKRSKVNIGNLLKLNGIVKTTKKVRWSTQIDETLYGGSA